MADLEQPLTLNDREGPGMRRAESIRGRAGDMREARRERIFSENQLRVAKWVFPIIVLLTLFVVLCAIQVFTVDAIAVKSLEGTSLYHAGLVIQIWYLVMLGRDLLITLKTCKLAGSSAL